MNMKYDYGDTVYVSSNAPENFRPGALGYICGMGEDRAADFGLASDPEAVVNVYTVEYGDGSSMEIPEVYLESDTSNESAELIRGKGTPGSSDGSWYNPKTGESLHPDLDHTEPIGPHWDYTVKGKKEEWRIYSGGRTELKDSYSGSEIIDCQKIALGEQAKLYVQNRLNAGRRLSRTLLNPHDIMAGTVAAYLPPDADKTAIENLSWDQFRYGGITSTKRGLNILVDIIYEFLSAGAGRICMFENYNADRTPTFATEFRSQAMAFGSEIYNAVLATKFSKEDIVTAIVESRSAWISTGVLTQVPEGDNWSSKREIDWREMAILAINAEQIIIRAFDGEGYLIWSKPEG